METINLAVLENDVVAASDDHEAPAVVVEVVQGDASPTVRTSTGKVNGFQAGKEPAAIDAVVTAAFLLPSEIAFRVRGFTVTPKRVEAHLKYWMAKGRYYKTDGAGRYARM
jgi:hypothetical protein